MDHGAIFILSERKKKKGKKKKNVNFLFLRKVLVREYILVGRNLSQEGYLGFSFHFSIFCI